MAKYMLSYPHYSDDMKVAFRKAFNLNPAYPIRQGNIIVKSRGVAHANQILDELGLPSCVRGCFRRDYSHPMYNDELIYKCESSESGILFSYEICATNDKYISWDDLKEYME